MENKDWQIKMRKIRAQQEKEFLDSWNENIIEKALPYATQMFCRFNIRLSEILTPNKITYVGLMRRKKVTVEGEGVRILEERVYERKLLFGGNSQFVKSFFIK